MKAITAIINWLQNRVAKQEWPGSSYTIQPDQELRFKLPKKQPAGVKIGQSSITLTYFVPNHAHTRKALFNDEKHVLISNADSAVVTTDQSYLTLRYVTALTQKSVEALQDGDWAYLVDQSVLVYGHDSISFDDQAVAVATGSKTILGSTGLACHQSPDPKMPDPGFPIPP